MLRSKIIVTISLTKKKHNSKLEKGKIHIMKRKSNKKENDFLSNKK